MMKENARELIVEILQDGINEGRWLSKHLCNKAMDIRKGKGNKDFLKFMRNFDNVKILNEGTHYHIEIKDNCKE